MKEPNLDYIKQLADEDESFKLNIIRILKREFPIEMAVFYKNYKAKEYAKAAKNIHKIKYKFSLLGLDEDFNLATNFENKIKTGDIKLFNKFESKLIKIDRYLKTI